ncbi:MAG: hypothetical protein A3G34_14450 [Candidatus Lindowbacteria bacterium RIFCSPLOWO2_12_FULL_62_27]|nr:MAG: hypothetical protein A3I06_16925 [Candidatus Lindowbacteria bacterium RIFCSPLOWO2_02_FULL_62_12]OGH62761.1 MAG: hypothetical protein A3G34_14450 [Candidatus Lindowbacteria bacterium RIFCSPLOWO2_12_FULL_62_27]
MVLVLSSCVAIFGLSACTKRASNKPAQVQTFNQAVEPRMGQDVLVERSQTVRPEWTLKPFVRQKETVEFSGGVKGVARYEVGVRQAKAAALKNIVEAIGSDLTTALKKTDDGDNYDGATLQSFISDRLTLATRKINIGGVTPTDIYYEKFKVLGPYGSEYRYDIDVRLQLDQREYEIARTRALVELRRAAQDARMPAIEAAMEKAFNELEKE